VSHRGTPVILGSGRAVDQGSEAKGMTVIVEVNKYAARGTVY
jgi:hypothetical protein